MNDKQYELPSKFADEENHCWKENPPKQEVGWLQKHFLATVQIKFLIEVAEHDFVFEWFQSIKFHRKFSNNPDREYHTCTAKQDCEYVLDDSFCWIPSYRFEVDEAANKDLWIAFKHHGDEEIYHQLLF